MVMRRGSTPLPATDINLKLFTMPRISFEHPLIDQWYERTGEGTSTFDVCTKCSPKLKTVKDFTRKPKPYCGDPIPADATVIETGSECPDIEESNAKCLNCGCKLTEKNYYE